MKNQQVVAIDGMPRKTGRKIVPANQKAVDALPLASGTWRVQGAPGLYVRCRAQSRSFILQRRIRGELVKQTIGEMSLKEARAEGMRRWEAIRPKPAGGRKTFAAAFQEFMADGGKRGRLAPKTVYIHRYNLQHYLSELKDRALEDIGEDGEGCRFLYRRLRQKSGDALANQVLRLVSAVYNHARRVNRKLPPSPTEAVRLVPIKPRDWALSPEALKKWWRSVEPGKHGKQIVQGVSTLGPVKKAWWLTALLTGARAGSVEALRWADLDLTGKTVRFMVTKGDRPYTVPVSDLLAGLLAKYRVCGDVPPSRWVFPSPAKNDSHIVAVRNDKEGVVSPHHMRHTFRTVLAELGASTDQARLLMGHSMGGDVSRGYITASLLVESLRPATNAVSERLATIVGDME